jgi:acetyl esterase
MSETNKMPADPTGYTPSGPLHSLAAQVASFFQADPNWAQMAHRPVAETRAWVRATTPVLGVPDMQQVKDFPVAVSGGEIAVRLYRPGARPLALLIWAHGGGFVLGGVDEADNFARALAKESRCAIASVDYRLAPEHPFPTAVNDLLEATRWVAARIPMLAGETVPLWLGGDSAGANLATVVTRKLHEANACAIAGNILAYPNTDSPDAPSLRRFDSPFLGIREIQFFLDQYLPDPAARLHPDFAPLHAPNLKLLPPTFIISAEHDILTEQAEAYGQQLSRCGVPVQVRRYAGMIHGFLTLHVFFPGAAGQAMRDIGEFLAASANARVSMLSR